MTPDGPVMIVPNAAFPSGFGAQVPDGEWIPVGDDPMYAAEAYSDGFGTAVVYDEPVCCSIQ